MQLYNLTYNVICDKFKYQKIINTIYNKNGLNTYFIVCRNQNFQKKLMFQL
jgi:hypothetical protein